MNKKVLLPVLLAAILVVAFAPQSTVLAAAGGKTLQSIVDALASKLVPLAASLATIAFIVAGIMFLSATGNPSRMTVAKGSLVAGVVGIVIVLLASGASDFVKNLFGL